MNLKPARQWASIIDAYLWEEMSERDIAMMTLVSKEIQANAIRFAARHIRNQSIIKGHVDWEKNVDLAVMLETKAEELSPLNQPKPPDLKMNNPEFEVKKQQLLGSIHQFTQCLNTEMGKVRLNADCISHDAYAQFRKCMTIISTALSNAEIFHTVLEQTRRELTAHLKTPPTP